MNWSEHNMNDKELYYTTFDVLELLLDIATNGNPVDRLNQKIQVYENKLSAFDSSSVSKLKETYGYKK